MASENAKMKSPPMRRCLGCMASYPKKDLIRLVRSPDGTVSLDFKGKVSGRGAYICKNINCFRKARKAKRFEHNLGCEIPDSLYDALEGEFDTNE